ncbi:hypothetical protein AYI70_g1966, partial [Smittium culicis]
MSEIIKEEAKGYKIPEIEKFSGLPEKYPIFMAAIKRQLWASPNAFSTDHLKISFVSAHLTDSAALWFEAQLDANSN